MKIIFQISGGIGKSIAATAVCKAIKKQYPKDELVVLTGYPDVFLQNPNVDTVLSGHLQYFFRDYVDGKNAKNAKIFLHDPYNETDFIYQRGHLIKVWCDMFGIKYNGELPELYVTAKEKTAYATLFASQKPVLVIQTNGGVSKDGDRYSWLRDMPIHTAQKVVNAFAQDYTVAHIRKPDQLQLQNTYSVTKDFREVLILLMMSHKRLLIDSFAQHAAAALGLPSHVCWIGNVPAQFGYELHNNIMANTPTIKPELRNAVFNKYNLGGQAIEFPYISEDDIFDADVLIEALRRDIVKEPAKSKKAELAVA